VTTSIIDRADYDVVGEWRRRRHRNVLVVVKT